MSKNIKKGKIYLTENDDLIENEEQMIFIVENSFSKDQISKEFLKKHSSFDKDGQYKYDYKMDKDEVWQDFRDMHNLTDRIDKIIKGSDILDVRNENDLSQIFYNDKPMNEIKPVDFILLDLGFGIKHFYTRFPIRNADVDEATIYTIKLGNGNVNAIMFEGDNYYGEIYEIEDLLDYLNKNYPDRDGFNYLKHTLNKETNDYKLLMMNHKDSDTRLDSTYFLIDKEEYEEYENGSRCLEDISVYDDNFTNICILSDEDDDDLDKTIILDYEKSKESKLTVDKLKAIVENHSVSADKPKSKSKIRRKM
ncbi:Uncharacterised protein [Vibrio cholerae]|nr:Uncharacterised protein [Vibrio cholerae]